MTLTTSLVLDKDTQARTTIHLYDHRSPIAAVYIGALTVSSELPSDLIRIGHALLDAADQLSTARRIHAEEVAEAERESLDLAESQAWEDAKSDPAPVVACPPT